MLVFVSHNSLYFFVSSFVLELVLVLLVRTKLYIKHQKITTIDCSKTVGCTQLTRSEFLFMELTIPQSNKLLNVKTILAQLERAS